MEPISGGWEPIVEQPHETLPPEEGDESATWQLIDSAEGHATAKDPASRKSAKRRTKTGCLTCRKRRIKCGEEKPICNNCIKSRRECEGYTQRLVFKRPVGVSSAVGSNYQTNAPMSATHPPFGECDGSFVTQQRLQSDSRLPLLAPRPTDSSNSGHGISSAPSSHDDAQTTNISPFHYSAVTAQGAPQSASETVVETGPEALSTGLPHEQSRHLSTTLSEDGRHRGPDATLSSPSQSYDFMDPQNMPWTVQPKQSIFPQQATYGATCPSVSRGQDHFTQPEISRSFGMSAANSLSMTTQEPRPSWACESSVPERVHPHAVYDYEDDTDSSDVDEEMLDQTQTEGFNQLSLIMSSANRDENQLRSFTTHLNEPNILASYRPTFGSSPLNNPKTARIFAHFIHSTGPSLSIFERHPADSSIALGAPVPAAQQGLWTYTIPLMALENRALLQAVLAVSSLHISFLQHAPPTPALKHYHYALKRIGSAVSLPLRRKQVGTLAATLLLGYYEVIAAEYTKWTSHMGGSSQLIHEIDLAGLTRDIRAHRRRIRAERGRGSRSPWLTGTHSLNFGAVEDDPFAEKESSIDERFISSIMGRVINYDEFGQVDDGKAGGPKKHFTAKEIENYRIQCDLYWWYSKQDIIRTLISGNKLFTPCYKWGQCPPRAGIGRLDAIYGSSDHLWLLLTRLADFGYRDRKRKLKAAKFSGEWSPGPELSQFIARFAGGAQGAGGGNGHKAPSTPCDRPGGDGSSSGSGVQLIRHPGRQNTSPTQENIKPNASRPQPSAASPQVAGRPMYGMIPPLGPIPLPSAFANGADHDAKFIYEDDENDQDVSYKAAESEWENILAAFDNFAHALGRDFLPLPPGSTPPISTPFGPALQYRTNTIAVVWGFYYAGLILLHRIHPSMPPAMMVAAGVATPTTVELGQTVGRIAGGVYYPQRYNFQAGRLNPSIGSCLVELTVPIYISAVQYTDPKQRKWIVTQMREVTHLTGWESAVVMGRGCESAWIVAAKQSRGPPHERILDDNQNTPFNESQKREEDGIQEEGNSERRFVSLSDAPRKSWAMGILSLEDDILNLDIEDR